eukprot:327210-Ditylum_brightwellii.AAC.1
MSYICNGAQKSRNILGQKIVDVGGKVIHQDCHHHLRNVWFSQVERKLSKALKLVLEDGVDAIYPSLHVTTSPSNFYVAVYKGTSITNNYAKGYGEDFFMYMKEHNNGQLLWHVQRTLGSRQDIITEGALP